MATVTKMKILIEKVIILTFSQPAVQKNKPGHDYDAYCVMDYLL